MTPYVAAIDVAVETIQDLRTQQDHDDYRWRVVRCLRIVGSSSEAIVKYTELADGWRWV